MKQTLLLILIGIVVMLASFIWFVATWDASEREPLTGLAAEISAS